MKKILFFILVLHFYECSSTAYEEINNNSSSEYLVINDLLSYNEFEDIKEFILKYGDKQTYRNYDNNNPHYSFEGFECYLNSEIGQENIKKSYARYRGSKKKKCGQQHPLSLNVLPKNEPFYPV